MIWKWSYITSTLTITNFTKNHFYFKVFRQNTRFRNYNIGSYSKFIRKLVVKNYRRLSWKNYALLSFFWVNNVLKNKKLISYLQYQFVYKYEVCITSNTNSIYKSRNFNLLEFGKHVINHIFLKKNMVNFFKLSQSNICKLTWFTKNINEVSYFNSSHAINKLLNLGFSFKNKYNFMPKNSKIKFYKSSIKIILTIIVNLKSLNSYLLLRKITTNY